MTVRDALADTTGYRVDTKDGRIGTVAAVLPRLRRDGPGVLIVHTGKLACDLTAIAYDSVQGVDVEARRIFVGDASGALDVRDP